MSDKFEKKHKEFQISLWKNDKQRIIDFFRGFGLDISDIYNHIINLEYDKMQSTCYLLSKIERAIEICDFLDSLESKKYYDVDKIKTIY